MGKDEGLERCRQMQACKCVSDAIALSTSDLFLSFSLSLLFGLLPGHTPDRDYFSDIVNAAANGLMFLYTFWGKRTMTCVAPVRAKG